MSRTPAARPAYAGQGQQANSRWPGGHPRRRLILLVLCLSLLVVVIDNTILNTALPTLARVLHAGTSSLQWITVAYTLCFAALLIPAGALGDRYGRRLSLLGGLTVFALGSTAAAFASGTGMLIGARVVMGLGAAFVMPATLSILNAVFPPKERPQATTVPAHQAGAGSAINDTIREVGGALGIAVVGSLSAAVYRSRLASVLATAHAPSPVAHLAASSIAAADSIGTHVGGLQGSELAGAAHSAFVNAMAMGMRVAAGVALVCAIGAVFALPPRRKPEVAGLPRPASAALVPAA